jgi:multidrug efflux pump
MSPDRKRVDLSRYKEFALTSFAVRTRVSVMVLLTFIGIVGLASYNSIPREAAPEVEIPIVVVNTMYPGVSPADIETLVTRVMEEELNTISDIKELRSTSVEGYSSITAEFQTSVDLSGALQKVREKVDLARPKLPSDAEEPSIVEINLSEFPIMQVNLSGEYGLVRLKEIGEQMQTRFEQLPQVLRADLRGGLEREVKVDVDLPRLQYYGLSLQDVVDAIRGENVNVPGGSIDVGTLKYLVRVDGEFPDPAVIEDIVVKTFGGRPVYVRDVASVEFGFAERESFARLDGTPVVTLDIVKRSGQNIIETSRAVKAVIADMQPMFPPTTVVKITSDQSENIHDMVSSLENNIISGLILIIAVLLFFLGLRTSAFVAISIPSSMLLSFLVLKALGITLNMVVLFSLILALGMLVDNAIVVVENIYRYLEEGWSRESHRRGRPPDHRRHRDHGGGVHAAPVLAGHRGRLHEVPAHHPHRDPVQFTVRCARHRAHAVRDVHPVGRRASGSDAEGRARYAGWGGRPGAAHRARQQSADGRAARRYRHRTVFPSYPGAGAPGPPVPGPAPARCDRVL